MHTSFVISKADKQNKAEKDYDATHMKGALPPAFNLTAEPVSPPNNPTPPNEGNGTGDNEPPIQKEAREAKSPISPPSAGPAAHLQEGGNPEAGEAVPDSGLGDITEEQVRQGGLNDCYLMAALASLASDAQGRQDIQAAVQHISGNRYEVRLFGSIEAGQSPNPIFYTIEYSTHGGGAIRSAPWVRVLEQAYTRLYGGQDVMGGPSGGTQIGGARRAFEHLTGRPASQTAVRADSDEDTIWTQLEQALASGKHVVAGTPRRLGHNSGIYGIYGGHNYSLHGVRGNGDARRVQVRNPWGERMDEMDADQAARQGVSNEAMFEITFAEFLQSFVQIVIDGAAVQASSPPVVQRQIADAEESLTATPGDRNWTSQYEELQGQLQNGGASVSQLNQMIRQAAQGLVPGDPLPNQSIPDRFHLVATINGSSSGIVAGTSVRAAYENPGQYWSWISFTPRIISETMAYSRGQIAHELQHCHDLYEDYLAYQASPGPHDVEGFLAYTQQHSQTEMRHSEIYAQQAAPDEFARWSQGERITWLQGALIEIPGHLGAPERLPVEPRINRFFQSANPNRKNEIFREFAELILPALGERRANDDAVGRAYTLLHHFAPVWAFRSAMAESWRAQLQRRD